MATSPIEGAFASFDGVRLAWSEIGEGVPVVLLHGLFSTAYVNWIKFGHAAVIAERGFRVIMPDLRAHGRSDKPHDPACYPRDVLVKDGLALIAHLGLQDYHLGGYSLGGRTAARMVVEGARPERLVISGMGIEGMLHTEARSEHFRTVLQGLGSFQRGSSEWVAETFLKSNGGDPEAMLLLLDSFVSTDEEELARISPRTLVLSGTEDQDNGSARRLADLLPNATFMEVPGNHMNVVTKPAFGVAIAEFLAA